MYTSMVHCGKKVCITPYILWYHYNILYLYNTYCDTLKQIQIPINTIRTQACQSKPIVRTVRHHIRSPASSLRCSAVRSRNARTHDFHKAGTECAVNTAPHAVTDVVLTSACAGSDVCHWECKEA